ncbi:MAG: monovalent cation/H(+) antiporter subunit G [Campylobacterota bacterium]|nr:monovalent cation/H(+) antiporter subunit G [Campylobacterota bacterium]
MIIDILSDICLLLGAIFTLTGAIGLLRLPNFYTRLHAASVTESLAAPLLIIGIMLDMGFTLDSAKLILIIVIMIVSNPTITHALCRAAAHGGVTPEMETKSNGKDQSQTKTKLSDKESK